MTDPAPLTFALVFAGLFGLVVGSFLNVVIYRVPEKVSLLRESRCPACEAPVRPWQNVPVLSWLALRGRCAECHRPISWRYPAVELATGVLFVAIAWFLPWVTSSGNGGPTSLSSLPGDAVWAVTAAGILMLVAFWWFAGSTIALALIDLDTKRLPNAIVFPGYLVGIALLTLACLLGAEWAALLRAVTGGIALFGLYSLLWFARPGAMGAGDVKLAGLVGLYLGWLGWAALAVGAIAAFILGGLFGVGLLATRRAGRKTAVAFGPWMILGAWTGVLAGGSIAAAYIGFAGLA